MWQQLLGQIRDGDRRALARAISLVENEHTGYGELLAQLKPHPETLITGITGPPGAGKSTIVDGLIGAMVADGKKVAVLCVDPSSPFNLGAVLGDRIRMSQWYLHPGVFIRSLATRGSMGGLHPKIIEITELVKEAGFDHIIVETVGVGQSEIEIAGLADTTVVAVVPEAGDEVQTMKAGLMEIAGIFVVNKSDRPGADQFVKNLRVMSHEREEELPVIKTVAHEGKGIAELYAAILAHRQSRRAGERRSWLLAERAWQLIQRARMRNIDRQALQTAIDAQSKEENFNLYRFASEWPDTTKKINKK